MTGPDQNAETMLRVVIAGGGTAGWMAANLMAHHWQGAPVSITVVESPDIGIIGVGEGSTPQLKAFFDRLGIAETDWMPACDATYKNGISFHGWSDRPGCEHYFHPFPSAIDLHTNSAFSFHSHFRRQGFDLAAHPDRFFLTARLARDRLAPLPDHRFPFDLSYGYHFDAYKVGAFLRNHAKSLGVQHIEATINSIDQKADGQLAALNLEDEEKIHGDFFVDATGFRALLARQTLGIAFQSFRENLFNDSAVVMPTPPDIDGLQSETRATALKNGWAWAIPLTNRTGNGYVYSARYCSADEAETELRAHLGLLETDIPVRHLKMNVGQLAEHWQKNCLAVGLSQGFIEPLEATALHLVQATVERFIHWFDAGGQTGKHAADFNRDISARFEGIRDYIVCHYKANLRRDSAYWRDAANVEALSEPLQQILQCWFSGGDLKQEIDRLGVARYYPLTSWICLLGGYGNYPPQDALRPPTDDLRQVDLDRIDDFIDRAALNFRDHAAVINALSTA